MRRGYYCSEGRLVSYVLVLCVVWRTAEGGYVAQYGLDYRRTLEDSGQYGNGIVMIKNNFLTSRCTEGSYSYPSYGNAAENGNYFISQMNFDLLKDAVATGSADRLVFLSTADLTPLAVYEWRNEDNENKCHDNFASSSPEVREFTCHNHIRVYQQLPSNSSLALVCGTQSAVQPQCRILMVGRGEGEEVVIKEFAAVGASGGLVSYLPQFTEFGQFRNSTDEDSVFLAAGFFDGESGAGRHFSISYRNITTATNSDPDSLATEELFRTISANNNWLTFPVTFVGVQRADYSVMNEQSPSDYQFWFIFLREQLVTDNVIYSRLVRVCRNDPGSMATDGGAARHFSTFMKARIFCVRDKPTTLEFIDSLDFVYNSITSFVFSNNSRYYDNSGPAKKLLYGSFTGPSNGPAGSALCVYPADNSIETNPDAGRTKSVFDIFREDIATDLTSTAVENTFLECAAEGRDVDDQQLLFINRDVSVEQIGEDPILVLDDVIVNHMVQDTVCVVTRGNRLECINQDVLFLGLDSGHVLKVVVGVGDNGETVPVIAEDIELDPGDPRNVTDMSLRTVGDEKFLFVSTDTRVYKLAVQRCSSRFPKCHCSECVASRDPYCVYNTESCMCEQNTLSPNQLVDDKYRQNIHSGTVESSCDCPKVGTSPSTVAVGEGEGSVTFVLSATRPVTVNISTVSGTAQPEQDYVAENSLIYVSMETTFTVTIVDDVALETAQEFNLSLSSAGVEVFFERSQVSVTILDNDGESGVQFSVLFDVLDLRGLSALSCDNQLRVDDEFTDELVVGVVSGVRSQCCHDYSSEHIIKRSSLFLCSQNQWQLLFQGETVATETANTSVILVSMATWAGSDPLILSAEGGVQLRPYDVCGEGDNSCSKTVTSEGLSSGSEQRDAFIAFLVLFLIVTIVCFLLGAILTVVYCRYLRNSEDLDKSDGIRHYPRKLSLMLFPGMKVNKGSNNGSQPSQTTAEPSSSLQKLVPPPPPPPTSSLSSDSSRQLEPVAEEDEEHETYFTPASSLNPCVPGSVDIELKNTAYEGCGEKGGGGGGREKTDLEKEDRLRKGK